MDKSIFHDAYGLLGVAQRKRGIFIVFLMIINALFDFFSLASFLPLLVLVVNPSIHSANSYLTKLYDYFSFSSRSSFIIAITLGAFLLVIIKSLISRWISKTKGLYAFGIGNELSLRALKRYLEMSYLDFSEVDFAKELSRISTHPIAFANNIILPVTMIITEVFVSILILVGIALYDFKVLFLVFAVMIPVLLIYRLRKRSLAEINRDLKEKYPLLTKFTLQTVEGLAEVKVYKKEHFFLDRFKAMSQGITRVLLRDQLIQNATVRITEITMGMIICVLVIYSVSVSQDYQQTLILLGIYAGASFRVLPSVNRILHASQQIRIHEYLIEELKPVTNLHTDLPTTEVLPLVFHETIEWRTISFAFNGAPPLLQNVSLSVRKGEKIGLIGDSGAGKTTLLLILIRLLKFSSGEFIVDGRSFQNESRLPGFFGYVPQNPYLLDGTIAENIAFGIPAESIDRPRVMQLIRDLDLGQFTNGLPLGIDTRIGERGIKLSGGQLQRLAIARALYAEAGVLLLDEITNQLHPTMEVEIFNLLDRLARRGTTMIMVTHKLPALNFFDAVYRLEAGRLEKVAADS